MGKSEKIKNERQKKWCSLHNSTSYSNQECFQQKKSDSKCKDSSTVDSRNSEEHEPFVVDSTTVDCNSCCCSDGKVARKSNESKLEYSPPPGIGFSFACCHPQTVFRWWLTPGLPSISLIRSWSMGLRVERRFTLKYIHRWKSKLRVTTLYLAQHRVLY